jgi:hypothetical protein
MLTIILKTGFGESWQKCLVHVTLANDSHDKPRWQEYFQKCPYKAKSRVFTDDLLCLTPLSAILQLYHGDQL